MQNRGIATKSQITEAALELFIEKGLEATSIKDISEKSGVSNGSLFHHFGSKNGIALAVYLLERRTYWSYVTDAVFNAQAAPAQALAGAVRAAVKYQVKHPRRHSFMIECASAGWISQHADAVIALNEEFTDKFNQWAEPQVRHGRLQNFDPQIIAALIFGSTQWLSRSWVTGLTSAPPTEHVDELAALLEKAFS